MKPIFVVLFLLLGRALAPGALGVLETADRDAAQSFALTNLAVLKASVTPMNYAFLGFHSTNDLTELALTNAVPVYSVALGRLTNYHAGDDFRTLLDHWSRVVVPIMVSTNVRSSLGLRFNATSSAFSDVKFGQRKLIRELMETFHTIPPAQMKSDDAPFVVELPVFDVSLIGYVNTDNQVVLLATVDLPLGPITVNRGQPLTEAAMLRLAAIAQRYNGLPN